jgi:hypothetical protein
MKHHGVAHIFVEHPYLSMFSVLGVALTVAILVFIWKALVGLANASLRRDLD